MCFTPYLTNSNSSKKILNLALCTKDKREIKIDANTV